MPQLILNFYSAKWQFLSLGNISKLKIGVLFNFDNFRAMVVQWVLRKVSLGSSKFLQIIFNQIGPFNWKYALEGPAVSKHKIIQGPSTEYPQST